MLILILGNEKHITFTDASGKYKFSKLNENSYSLNVRRLGYDKIDTVIKIASNINYLNLKIRASEIITDNINVTASRSELTLKQTPSSANVINRNKINNGSNFTFDEVLNNVQGITIFKSSGINVQSLSIRGSSDVAGGGIGNRVLLLVDGRPSLTGDSKGALWSLVPVSIIDRTEVVKGAFSSLYGSNAIGGVINVITKKPTYKPYTSLNLSAGFYEKLNDSLKWTNKLLKFSSADITHSNSAGRLAYLLNLSYRGNDGHAEQTAYKFINAMGKFMYDVLRNRDLEMTLQYTESNADYPHYWRKDPGKVAEPYKTNPVYIGDKIKKKSWSCDAFYTAFPSSEIKYNSRFYFNRLSSLSYYNPNNFVSKNYGTPGKGFETYIASYNFGNISQLDFHLSEENYLISGIDLEWNIVRSEPDYILYGNQQSNNLGIFIQNKHILVKKSGNEILSGTFGLRSDYSNFIGYRKFFQISPKISILYSPQLTGLLEETSFRFLLGRAFRTPSIAELYFKKELFGGFDFVFNTDLKPEEMISAEIGLRKQFGKKLSFDLSAYINNYDNLIQYVNIGNQIQGPFQVQNIAKAQIKGIELQTDFSSPFKLFKQKGNLAITLSYSYTDARDLSPSRNDELLPYKPRHLINLNAFTQYSMFVIYLSSKYVSKTDEVIFFKYEEPDEYFLVDLKLTAKLSTISSAYLAINNLLNTSYQELERIQAPNRRFSLGISLEFPGR